MKNIIITLILVALATITNAQNYFKAKVLDSESNEALIGATLILEGTTNGVSTDVNGLATLKNIPNGDQTIIITFIGYDDENLTFSFPIESKKVHTVLLSASDTEINEII
ncbi:MAG: carboxypeptidase-like regulatory domain-containing protein, partial [Flavobacteriales bacterium]|nr:carboxypeptidase-like regulatory domain-containing protein [Flavobacteriales bacterium]